MAKKKLDLMSSFEVDTGKTHDKHKKYTAFMEREISKPVHEKKLTSGDEKLFKRINMAFNNENYEFIQEETIRLGINIAYFINKMIEIIEEEDINEYIESLPVKPSANATRRRGVKLKRINLKFPIENYEKIAFGAQKNDVTITQYVNILIGVYTQ